MVLLDSLQHGTFQAAKCWCNYSLAGKKKQQLTNQFDPRLCVWLGMNKKKADLESWPLETVIPPAFRDV